jgi:hypothetical protein
VWRLGGKSARGKKTYVHRFGERSNNNKNEILYKTPHLSNLRFPRKHVAGIDDPETFNQNPPVPKSYDNEWNDIEMLFAIPMFCLMALQYGGLHACRRREEVGRGGGRILR